MRVEEPRRLARLDASERHVLCGSQLDGIYLCNRELGPIHELVEPPAVRLERRALVIRPEPAYPRVPGVAIRAFRFPAGWLRRADDVWDRHGPHRAEETSDHYRELDAWSRRVTELPGGILRAVRADRPPAVPELPARAVSHGERAPRRGAARLVATSRRAGRAPVTQPLASCKTR